MSKDYYKILGAEKSASQDDIKKAFRVKAHQYHPDKATGDEAKFKEINEAFQVLSNPQKRSQYDQFGSDFSQGQPGGGFSGWQDFSQGFGGSNINFEDLGDMMGDVFGFGGSRGQSRAQAKGNDLQMILTITLEEAAFGVERDIDIHKGVVCEHCKGNGAEPGSNIKTCATCHGKGEVIQAQRTILGSFQSRVVCPDCQGEGKTYSQKCTKCHGQGVVKDKVKMKIKIPAGIDEGQNIRLTGQGEAGLKGSRAGDLFIKVRVKPNPNFDREGSDIKSTAEIKFNQAALGDKIDVEILDGKVKLKVPEGTQSGTIFRLKGKGVHRLQSRGRGDHLVKVVIKTPKSLTKKQRDILTDLNI